MGLPMSDASVNESSALRHADKFIELRRNQLADEIESQLKIIDTMLLAMVSKGEPLNDPIFLSLDKELAYFVGITINRMGYYVRYSDTDTETLLLIQIRA